LAKGIQYLFDCVVSSEPKSQVNSRRNITPSDDEILDAFKQRIDFEPLLRSLELSKLELSNLRPDQSVKLLFYARLARNIKRLLHASDPERSNIDDLIVKSANTTSEQSIDQSKFVPLKKATEETFENIRSKIMEIKSELTASKVIKQVVQLSKVARNIARIHSESKGEPLSFLSN